MEVPRLGLMGKGKPTWTIGAQEAAHIHSHHQTAPFIVGQDSLSLTARPCTAYLLCEPSQKGVLLVFLQPQRNIFLVSSASKATGVKSVPR